MKFTCQCAEQLAVVVLLLSSACSNTVERGPRRGALAAQTSIALDPTLVSEVVPFTTALIRAAPVNAPGGEGRVVRILADRFAGESNITVETTAFDDVGGRENLLAVVVGRDPSRAPILLVGHSDVVPAESEAWGNETPPFSGARKGGHVFGRGALDMLGMVALESLTLVNIARQGGLDATVVLLVAGDEEVDGKGMQHALTHWPIVKTAALAINEGGFIIDDGIKPGHDMAAVSVSEKGFVHLEVTARGEAGHGSSPNGLDDAPERLVRAVGRVLARHDPFTLTPDTFSTLSEIGRARGGLESVVLQQEALIEAFAARRIDGDPALRTQVHNTCALTILESGYKRNVIPATARAVFDCRILPGTDPQAFYDEILLAIDDPKIEMRVLASSRANGSASAHVFLDVVRELVVDESRLTTFVPILTRGFTDSRFLRAAGIPSYGFVPMRVSFEELSSIHGRDERVREAELEQGLHRLNRLVSTVDGAMATTTVVAK